MQPPESEIKFLSTKDMASAIYSKTQTNLINAAKKMGHSIENGIKTIKIAISKDTFLSFVFSDTLPDNFEDGDVVGFIDVSGFCDRLPDGQYKVDIFLDKSSEFINVTTEKKYFFETNIKEKKDSNSRSNKRGRFCIPLDEGLLLARIVGEICFD